MVSDKIRVSASTITFWEFGRCLLHCERHRDGARGGLARHEDHFRLEGGPVRVLGSTTLDGSGDETLRFIGFPIEFHVVKSKEKEVTDSGKNEDDYRGKEGDEQIEEFDEEKENEEMKKKL